MEKKIEFKVWYRQQFFHSVCHVCKKGEKDFVCKMCKLVKYCSPGCMEEDKEDHEEICEALTESSKFLKTKTPFEKGYLLGAEEWRNFRLGIAGICSKYLKRPLQSWEIEICLFPPVCETCHKFDPNITCSRCSHGKWCSKEHMPKNHEKHCENLILFREILQRKVNTFSPVEIERIASTKNMDKDKVISALMSEVATSPLTALQVIPQVETCVVHVVGPEPHFEANNLVKWEKFLFDLISTRELTLVFIGPEIGPLPERKITKNNRVLNIKFHEVLYHEYEGPNPNLICAFNPGLYRNTGFGGKDTWSETIKIMFSYPGVPVLVTSYTEKEIKLDFKRIKEAVPDVQTVIEPSENPFSSLRPLLNFVSDESTPIVFKNAYYTVVNS